MKEMVPFSREEAKALFKIINIRRRKANLFELSQEEFQFMFWIYGGSARLLSSWCTISPNKEINDFVDREMSDFLMESQQTSIEGILV